METRIWDLNMVEVQLCNCGNNCPAHPKIRFVHIGDKCIHADGTSHKIKYKK